ncbi:MAG: glycosyltransferase family 39 protein [Pyrinomonadaceae bacterium]
MLKINWLIILPLLIAVSFSVLAIWFFGFERVEFGDTQDYINAANAFLNGMPYPRQSVFHPMFRPPLYPLFISLIWSVFPNSIIAVKLAQALLHGATVLVIYKIIYEILRKHTPAFFGALFCAINPLLIAHTTDFYTEPLHTFLCALAMLFLVKLLKDDKFSYLNAFYAGAIFGLATLCRPAILGVALCLAVVIALIHLKKIKRTKYLIASAVFFVSIFLATAPWTLQNYRDTGEFILVNDGFSYNLWLGNLPETIVLYEGGFESKEENQKFADYVWGEAPIAKLKELEQTDNYYSLTFNEREKVWRREALKNMTADYGLTARLMLGKLWNFWTPFLNHFTYGYKMVIPIAVFVIATCIFGLYGAYIFSSNKTGKKFIILLAVSFLATTAIHVLIFGFVRYRVPNVDPYLSMLTGVALWHIAVKLFPKYDFLQN